MTLTNRLSLFLVVVIAVVLVTFSAVLYALADHYLPRQLDDRLDASLKTLASAAEVEPDGVEWEPHTHPLSVVHDEHLYWIVTDDTGAVIDRSPQPRAADLMDAARRGLAAGHRSPRRVNHSGRAWRVGRVRVEHPAPPSEPLKPRKHVALEITVAVPLGSVHETLRTLGVALVGLTSVILAAVLMASRAVCRRALAPVTRMAAAARSMGAADLTHRLPRPVPADELGLLADSFNGLLGRLAEAFARERRFTGEASHQLRTPLTALIGQVEVALRRDRTPEEYRRALGAVLEQAQRLHRVVEALLYLARSEADARPPDVERVDLAAWVPAYLRRWEAVPRAADLVFESPAGAVPVAIHPDLFGELLDALIDNAVKYSAPGTPVTVRTGGTPDRAWVEVEDRGCGVAVDEVPHLFRPFFRSQAARQRGAPGVGLGLAVAARIAGALGGTIEFASEVGRGSRVTVRLPSGAQPLGESQ